MEFVKDFTVNDVISSFDSVFSLWVMEKDSNQSGYIDEWITDLNCGYYTLQECLDVAKTIPLEFLDNHEVVLQWELQIYDEKAQGYQTVTLDLVKLLPINNEIKLEIAHDVLLMIEAQLSAVL
jgi:hypothetical protein